MSRALTQYYSLDFDTTFLSFKEIKIKTEIEIKNNFLKLYLSKIYGFWCIRFYNSHNEYQPILITILYIVDSISTKFINNSISLYNISLMCSYFSV